LAATSADGRFSMPPRPCCRDLPRPPSSCSRRDFFKLFHRVWRESTKRRLFSKPSFSRGCSGSPAQLWLTLTVSAREGHGREGRHGGGGSLRMWRGGPGGGGGVRGGQRMGGWWLSRAPPRGAWRLRCSQRGPCGPPRLRPSLLPAGARPHLAPTRPRPHLPPTRPRPRPSLPPRGLLPTRPRPSLPPRGLLPTGLAPTATGAWWATERAPVRSKRP